MTKRHATTAATGAAAVAALTAALMGGAAPLAAHAQGEAAAAAPAASYPFQNPDLPLAQRVDDLVSRMTLEEKAGQMMTDAPAIPRLGLPAYYWWSECLHGNAGGIATVFPQAIALASTWDVPLHSQIAVAISDEDRARYNQTVRDGMPRAFQGATFFSPNINIFRDPRWGRGQETYGEDPYLMARFGVAYVKGLQGDDPKYLKVVSTPKHFAVHSGPESLRHRFDAVVSDYDLYDTYLPAFRATVRDAHAYSVMGAYSSLDGVPCNANSRLLGDILRKDWGFAGYVVSDCGAISDIYRSHHYAKTAAEAAADAVKAGCDLACDDTYRSLPEAVQQGLISEATIDTAVKRLFTARFKLGMFDPPARVAYARIPFSAIDSPAHRQLALRAAHESIVLLKNAGMDALPFGKGIKTLAVIGPNADSTPVLLGNYNGTPSRSTTILDGIRRRAAAAGIRVEYVKGSGLLAADDELPVIPASALRYNGRPGLHAEYFKNENLEGAPFTVRQEPQVDENIDKGEFVPGLSNFHFSARWTGNLVAPQDGDYTLSVRGDDGFRLFLNGEKVIEDWGVHPPRTGMYKITLKAGQPVPIKLEFFQAEGGAEISLRWDHHGPSQTADAVAAAKRADAVVFVGGINSQLEGEEGTHGNGDRTDIALPAVQQDLLKAVVGAGKPVVLVLMSGSALAPNWAQASPRVPAILEAWYPGEEGGTAVADVLFGDYNPAGRLPVTFYKSVEQLPAFTDYAMKARTYRYFTGEPLYRFGDGLSYTTFHYSVLTAPRSVTPGLPVTVTAQVANTGKRAGDEVVELYLRPDPDGATRQIAPGQPMPRLILAGFQRVPLAPGQKRTVSFTLTPEQLLLVNAKGKRALQPETWRVYVGGHQPDLARPVAAQGILSGTVRVK